MASIIDSTDPFGDGSLVAKYQLNGDATDLTGNFNGVANNVTYDDGEFGQAGVFNGVDSQIAIDGDWFNTSTGFAFSLRVKTSSIEYSGLIRQGVSGDNPLVSLSNNGAEFWDISIEFSNGDQYSVPIDATLLNNNEWHNILANVDLINRLLVVYIDGEYYGEVDLLVGTFINMDSPIYIGGMGDPSYSFDGLIDQVEIYNRALTAGEVGDLFTQTRTPTVSIIDSIDPFNDGSLVAKYQLNGDATDLTGNFNGVAKNVTYDDGEFGQAGVFNGVDSWIDTGNPFALLTGTYSFFYKYGGISEKIISSVSVNPTIRGQISVRLISATELIFEIVNGGTDLTSVTVSNLDDGKFHHFAFSFQSNGKFNCYLDGDLLDSRDIGEIEGDNTQNLWLMRYPRFETQYKSGTLEQLEIYNRALTAGEVGDLFTQTVAGSADPIVNFLISLSSITWSNRETKEQANPQPIYLENHGVVISNNKYAVKNNIFKNDVVLDQNGEQHKFGYIESTTQVSGVPVGFKRVVLFADDSCLIIDETVSDAVGNYRFDSLLLGKKYMITAQYGSADAMTPPEYSATSIDWQSPTPYVED